MHKYFIATLVALLGLTACIAVAGSVDKKSMSTASADLLRLSYAVQGEIMRGAPAGSDLLTLACGRDASLCTPLADYHIGVKQEGDNAVLLLCTADQNRALLEDIACTPRMDAAHWEKGTTACQFTLSATGVCP